MGQCEGSASRGTSHLMMQAQWLELHLENPCNSGKETRLHKVVLWLILMLSYTYTHTHTLWEKGASFIYKEKKNKLIYQRKLWYIMLLRDWNWRKIGLWTHSSDVEQDQTFSASLCSHNLKGGRSCTNIFHLWQGTWQIKYIYTYHKRESKGTKT